MSSCGGRGVFATQRIEANELVTIWGGPILSTAEVQELAREDPEFEPRTVSIHNGFHLGYSQVGGEVDDTVLINHSCDPNIGIKGQIVLLARRVILPDEEVCFDYDTTEVSPPPPHFHCQCGSAKCRGTINGSGWKNPRFLEENRGWLSWNVEDHVRRLRAESVQAQPCSSSDIVQIGN